MSRATGQVVAKARWQPGTADPEALAVNGGWGIEDAWRKGPGATGYRLAQPIAPGAEVRAVPLLSGRTCEVVRTSGDRVFYVHERHVRLGGEPGAIVLEGEEGGHRFEVVAPVAAPQGALAEGERVVASGSVYHSRTIRDVECLRGLARGVTRHAGAIEVLLSRHDHPVSRLEARVRPLEAGVEATWDWTPDGFRVRLYRDGVRCLGSFDFEIVLLPESPPLRREPAAVPVEVPGALEVVSVSPHGVVLSDKSAACAAVVRRGVGDYAVTLHRPIGGCDTALTVTPAAADRLGTTCVEGGSPIVGVQIWNSDSGEPRDGAFTLTIYRIARGNAGQPAPAPLHPYQEEGAAEVRAAIRAHVRDQREARLAENRAIVAALAATGPRWTRDGFDRCRGEAHEEWLRFLALAVEQASVRSQVLRVRYDTITREQVRDCLAAVARREAR